MTELIVLKSGGTSNGSPEGIIRLGNYVRSLEDNVIVVVSAPASDKGRVTKLLREKFLHSVSESFIESFYTESASRLGVDFNTDCVWAGIDENRSEDYLVSRGEHAQAILTNLVFNNMGIESKFVNAADVIITDSNEGTGRILGVNKDAFTSKRVHVIGGFYGADEHGKIVTLPDGGSDITAGFLAAAFNAREYVNLKDVPGIYVVDPKLVKNPKIVPHMTYSGLRESLYRARKEVLEANSLDECREAGIPIRVRSLAHSGEGTLITATRDLSQRSEFPITNIAHKEDFVIYNLKRGDVPFVDLLELFREISIDMVDTLNGEVSLAVHNSYLGNKRTDVEKKLGTLYPTIETHDSQTLISIVGEGLRPTDFRNWITNVHLPDDVVACYGPILGGPQANRGDMTVFYVEYFGMHSQVGYARKLARFFEQHDLDIVASSTSIDAFAVGVREKLSRDFIEYFCRNFSSEVGADNIFVTNNGVPLHGRPSDVSNVTIAVPHEKTPKIVSNLYNEFLERGYFI